MIRTKRGEEKVIANDIFRERVTLRGEDGEVRTIALAESARRGGRSRRAAAGRRAPSRRRRDWPSRKTNEEMDVAPRRRT